MTADPWSFEVREGSSSVLLHHDEGRYDALTPADIKPGPQPAYRFPSIDRRTDGDFLELGENAELNGRRLDALRIYKEGLARFADSAALNKAAGRLATTLHWPEASASSADEKHAILWLEKAYRRNTTDMETRYYLGLAHAAVGDDREAREHLEAAQRFAQTNAPARLQLARLEARGGRLPEALATIEALVADRPENTVAGATEVVLLRLNKQRSRARQRCAYWRRLDPTSNLLRFEALRLGAVDQPYWSHLAADANRLLSVVDQYLALDAFEDAWMLLDRTYPQIRPPAAEPGAGTVSANPLVAYYRAFVGQRLGRGEPDAYRRASALSTTYVFPNRASSYAVLDAALTANPDDGTARLLRGSLYLSSGLIPEAIADWERARRVAPDLPTLHRNLGLTLLHEGKTDAAIAVLKDGIAHDPRNVEVYTALDQAYGVAGAPVSERVASLERYPDAAAMPPVLVYKLALARAEQNDVAKAEALFQNRFFPREEGGLTPERVLAAVRVVAARAAARSGRCDAALRLLGTLDRVGDGIALDQQAIAAAANGPLLQSEIAGVESLCGRQDAARERRQKLAQSREQLEAQLDDLSAALEEGDGGSGLAALTQARILWTLGRVDAARQAVSRVFTYPDRGLSYLFAGLLREDLERGAK
jgi:tetratricopeptide (TPR) repeat protein